MKNDNFYMVWRYGANNPMANPSAKALSRERALKKAKEMAKAYNRTYYIMKPIAKVEVETTITTKTINIGMEE